MGHDLHPDHDGALVWRLAHGDATALEPLMRRWGEPVLETCYRALRDAPRTFDLYGEVWAEAHRRIPQGTERLPADVGSWLVEVIGAVLETAAADGRIPGHARARMGLATTSPTAAELAQIDELRDPRTLRETRERLPRDFSAAADRMLLRMPSPSAIGHIAPSHHDHDR